MLDAKASLAQALLLALTVGCAPREPLEDALARSQAALLTQQIASLQRSIGRIERGELSTTGEVAIGVSQDLAARLLNASLPIERVVAGRLRVRVDSARPVFAGSQAALLVRATVGSADLPRASASLDIEGSLESFELAHGRLRARMKLAHFAVRESALGDLAADAIEDLVRANVSAVESVIPALEIPIELDRAIAVAGLVAGPVVARPGMLPIDASVSQVIVVRQRLWVLLKVQPGRWQTSPAPAQGALQ
jgi:hypothetical protein